MPRLIAPKHEPMDWIRTSSRLTFTDMFWFKLTGVVELKVIVCARQ